METIKSIYILILIFNLCMFSCYWASKKDIYAIIGTISLCVSFILKGVI